MFEGKDEIRVAVVAGGSVHSRAHSLVPMPGASSWAGGGLAPSLGWFRNRTHRNSSPFRRADF